MSSKHRRGRGHYGSQSSAPPSILTLKSSNAINNNSSTKVDLLNGHQTHNHQHQTDAGLNGTIMGNGGSRSLLTEKQQQQIDRNNYLTSLTKDQLKTECRKRGQKTSGTKTELLQRLGFKMPQQPQSQQSASNNKSQSQQVQKTASGQKAASNAAAKTPTTPNGTAITFARKQSKQDREKERNEREKLVLHRHPIQTIKYCSLEVVHLSQTYGKKISQHQRLLSLFVFVVASLVVAWYIPGRHQSTISFIRLNLGFIIYWLGLGVLSSVGLGTGLHTFLLYLGPHIASVTLAAYECNSLNFPAPPYPDEIICPENATPGFIPSLWNIMGKVRFEAFLWGVGTALGELPPYFMAKASRLSGYDPDDADDLKEFEELKKKQESGSHLNILDRAKLSMERIVERVGFLGILACASIPNPLFDLAGITCGHFLVPFWTFFGATLIGKAIIKMHLQKVFVIIAFNETLIQKAVDFLVFIPVFGKKLQEPFKTFLVNQKLKLHGGVEPTGDNFSLLPWVFEKFVICMVMYFVISILNSLAQSYHKRIHKKYVKVNRKVARD